MGEKQSFGEVCFAGCDDRIDGNAGERFELFQHGCLIGEGHQAGARFDHLDAELVGDTVRKAGGTHLRNGFPAAGDDHRRGLDGATGKRGTEAFALPFDPVHAR